MGSKNLMEFKNAIEYMDPMQVTDYLQKTLHFLESNNSEIMFPSISPYVETFLVNLVSDTRNLKSQALKPEDRTFAEKIIEVLEMSREVFRWTHAYEKGNLLVYKKIFSSKMKKKPIKLSAIADRLIQARASDLRRPRLPYQNIPPEPKNGIFTTGFKLRFLQTTLNFVKNDTEAELHYDEMPMSQAEYLYNLIKYRDKEVGFGYKSLYATLWEAMEEYGTDYKFKVVLKETENRKAILTLEKIPKNKTKECKDRPRNIKQNKDETNEDKKVSNSPRDEKAKSYDQIGQSISNNTSTLPSLDLISNISEKFFRDTINALTDFADDENCASHTFSKLTMDELMFVKKVKKFAASTRIRESFEPRYRDRLWRLNYSINEAKNTCKITTTVNEAEGSISLKKTALFASPAPIAQQSATGARSKSVVSTRPRDRSLSKDRLIQFEKGGNIPATLDKEQEKGRGERQQEQGKVRSGEGLSKRKAKLLEDLSTPVESDIGMRMMLLMGWNGGALGARGEGIIEPVMPVIELPKRGGLGHVPPPKPEKKSPRRPIDFRLTLLHNIHDLLLHEELQKEIIFKEPLSKKENSFIRHSLTSINSNANIELTAKENDIVAAISSELKNTPGLIVRATVSGDLRAVTLQKLFDQPAKQPKPKTPKPKPVKLKMDLPQNIPDQDIDVITPAEVKVTAHKPKPVKLKMDLPQNIPDQDIDVITPAEVKVTAHKPKPVKLKMDLPQNIPDQDIDVITSAEVKVTAHKPKPVKLKIDLPQNIPDQDIDVITPAEVKVTAHKPKPVKLKIDLPQNIPDQDIDVITPAEVKVTAHKPKPVKLKIDLPQNIPDQDIDVITPAEVKVTAHKPKPVKLKMDLPQNIPDQDIDVITSAEVKVTAHKPKPVKLKMDLPQNIPDQDIDVITSAEVKVTAHKPKPVKLKMDLPQNIPDQDINVITSAEVKVTAHKPKPVKLKMDLPQNILDQDIDVVITNAELKEVTERVDLSDLTMPASNKVLNRRAIRLLFMMKFAQTLSVEWQGQIVYKFEGTLPKRTKSFLKSIIEHLNGDAWMGNLLRGEHPVYEDLMRGARGSLLSLDFRQMSKFVLTRVPLINEDYLNNSFGINNNNIIDLTQDDSLNKSDTNNANVTENLESQRFIPTILKDESNIDINMAESDENDNIIHRNDIENDSAENFRINTIMENLENMKIYREFDDKCYNLIASIEKDQLKEAEVKKESEFSITETNSNKETDNVINIENTKKEVVNFEDNTLVCDVPKQYDLDRDVQELEMTTMNAKIDFGSAIKIEQSSDISPDDSEIDLITNVKQETDDSNISGKRSHSNSICSEELDPKKTKVIIESDDNLVIIAPKNPEENMAEDIIKEVQTVMARELDKSGGFLPLLKCHGAQNGGLVYSCHDDDDVAWLENVISVANLNLQLVPAKDLLLYEKNRELLIKMNSFIPLDTKKIFRKFEIYNVGLDTKFWKVTHKHTTDSFVMLIVTVDEKSFKYITDEKFSLYCGIDKAQFSIIF